MKGMILGLWLLVVVGGMALGSAHRRETSVQREQADILLDVFGEFRTVLARYLWFKMDLFHEVLDDEGLHDSQQTELMPLLRMISLLDSSMTDAYDNIAWDLFKGHQQPAQALKILDEGLAQNPGSFQLNFRSSLIRYQDEQYPAALESAVKAVALASDEFDILNANRMLYWSAQKVGNRAAMSQALDALQTLRPNEPQWRAERAALER